MGSQTDDDNNLPSARGIVPPIIELVVAHVAKNEFPFMYEYWDENSSPTKWPSPAISSSVAVSFPGSGLDVMGHQITVLQIDSKSELPSHSANI